MLLNYKLCLTKLTLLGNKYEFTNFIVRNKPISTSVFYLVFCRKIRLLLPGNTPLLFNISNNEGLLFSGIIYQASLRDIKAFQCLFLQQKKYFA